MPEYRANDKALSSRRNLLQVRVRELRAMMSGADLARLTDKQVREHEELIEAMAPRDKTLDALLDAEAAADRYEAWAKDALDLAIELEKHEKPVLPEGRLVLRWVIYFLVGIVVIPVLILAALDRIHAFD